MKTDDRRLEPDNQATIVVAEMNSRDFLRSSWSIPKSIDDRREPRILEIFYARRAKLKKPSTIVVQLPRFPESNDDRRQYAPTIVGSSGTAVQNSYLIGSRAKHKED